MWVKRVGIHTHVCVFNLCVYSFWKAVVSPLLQVFQEMVDSLLWGMLLIYWIGSPWITFPFIFLLELRSYSFTPGLLGFSLLAALLAHQLKQHLKGDGFGKGSNGKHTMNEGGKGLCVCTVAFLAVRSIRKRRKTHLVPRSIVAALTTVCMVGHGSAQKHHDQTSYPNTEVWQFYLHTW